MEEIGPSEGLRKRIINIYKKTKNTVRIEKERSILDQKGGEARMPLEPNIV